MISEIEFSRAPVRYDDLVRPDGVHSRVYTDEAIFAEELDKIWRRGWVYVGHDSEVPNPGDFIVRRIATQPVVMVRREDGTVGLLLNRCPHRGNSVCLEESGNTDHFRCVYHGWTFNTDGTPHGVPYSGRYGQEFEKEEISMEPLPRMESHRGFVYGSLNPTGTDLKTHLGRTYDYIDRFVDLAPDGEVDLSAGALRTRVHGNWKMAFENICDGYHPPFLHRSVFVAALRKGTVVNDAYGDDSLITTRDLEDGHIMLDFVGTNRRNGWPIFDIGGAVSPEATAEYRAALEAKLGIDRATDVLYDGLSNVGIFPNLGLLFQDLRVIEPVSVNETIIHNFPTLLKGAPREINRQRMYQEIRAYGPGGSVGPDDHEIYERNQLGFQAKVNEWLVLRRGIGMERVDDDGTIVGNATDETTQRAFWRHYLRVMSGE